MNGMPAVSSASFTCAKSRESSPCQMDTMSPSPGGGTAGASSASTSGTSQSEHCVTPARYSHLQLGQIIGAEFYTKKLVWSQRSRERIGKPLGGLSAVRDLPYDTPRAWQSLGADAEPHSMAWLIGDSAGDAVFAESACEIFRHGLV